MSYILAPFIGWILAGSVKFLINYLRYGQEARERIGNGGFPSNHTTIIFSEVMLIGFKNGFYTPMFGLGVAIAFIVIIDATGLRRHVGKHAKYINAMNMMVQKDHANVSYKKLRESIKGVDNHAIQNEQSLLSIYSNRCP